MTLNSSEQRMKFSKTFATMAAAAALLAAPLVSQAAIVVIDDFAVPASPATVSEWQVGNTATIGPDAPVSPSIATNRLITLEVTENNRVIPSTGDASVSVGGGGVGYLSMSNDSGVNSKVTIEWTTGAFTLDPGPAGFAFDVIFANIGTPAADISVALEFVGGLGSFTAGAGISSGTGYIETFILGAADAIAFAGGGTLKMIVTGTPSWELDIDSISFRVPEPGSLALAGLALMGLAAARRRKA